MDDVGCFVIVFDVLDDVLIGVVMFVVGSVFVFIVICIFLVVLMVFMLCLDLMMYVNSMCIIGIGVFGIFVCVCVVDGEFILYLWFICVGEDGCWIVMVLFL